MAVNNALAVNLRNGIVGSLAGGIVFGMLMTMMGMMEMVAQLVRSESIVVGWLVHLGISFVFGVVFGYLLHVLAWNRFALGAAWGIAAWIGGALILMPLFLGMPGMVLNLSGSTPWMSLMGHLLYGLVAGGVVYGLERTRATEASPTTA